mgnify:CR=1 FL=1
MAIDLSKYGITGTTEIVHNPSYETLFAEETNGTAAYIMMPKGSSVGFTVRIGTAGTYRLILRCVTDNQGPTIRFAVDGVDTRNKVCMANSGNGWTYTEFDLGLVTMAAGKHEITITALDQSNQAFVLDNLYIRLAEEGETDPEPEPEEKLPQTGMLWWPVPVLACGGISLFFAGWARRRRQEDSDV